MMKGLGFAVVLVAALVLVAADAGSLRRNPMESSFGSNHALVSDTTRSNADRIIKEAFRTETVFDRLAFTCDTFGPRFSGTPALEQAIDHIIQVARLEDNLEVIEEPVMIPVWVRGREYAKLVRGSGAVKEMKIAGLGMSIGTPNQAPLRAEVIVVSDFDELEQAAQQGLVKGRMVLFNVPFTTYGQTVMFRIVGATKAAQAGAVAMLLRSVGPYSLQTPHTGTSVPSSIPAAAVTLEDAELMHRMQKRGQKIVVELLMEAHTLPDVQSRNVIIQIKGTDKQDEVVLIGGHIDSWDLADGAMDDGGGAFVSWEAIRLIAQTGIKPRRTIRAVLFVNEENGARGGQQYAKDHDFQANKTTIAIESDEGTFTPFALGFTGSDEARAQLKTIGAQLLGKIGSGNVTDTGGGTDVGYMCSKGVPCGGLQVLDPRIGSEDNNPCKGFNSGGQPSGEEIPDGYFWYHHTAADTPDKLSPHQLQHCAASLAVWAYGISELEDMLPR